MKLVLHPQTKNQISSFISKPSHALALLGKPGTGKKYTAQWIAEKLLGKQQVSGLSLMIVRPDDRDTIGIEQSRQISHFLQLKSVLRQAINRVVIIEDSHRLTIEAQQALLKTLEEPDPGTCLILTVSAETDILPTVYSRVTKINVKNPPREEIINYFNQSYSANDVARAWLISNGRIGLMHAMLTDNDHPVLASIQHAKRFISDTTFMRLCAADNIAKENIHEVLDALAIVSQAGFTQAVSSNKKDQAKRWHHIRKLIIEAQINSRHNPNVKLLLSNLALAL